MKFRLLLLGLAMTIVAIGAQAQKKDITKFMGIPIDGTKTAMIQKLKAKGFTYNAKMDRLEGEFNGRDSYISVVTNRNKVYRIVVRDANYTSERDIKIRFNTLVRQFLENKQKYMPFDIVGNYLIDDDVDVSYEITVHNKRFEAAFYQIAESDSDTTGIRKYMNDKVFSKYTEVEFYAMSEDEQNKEMGIAAIDWMLEKVSKRQVWFIIDELYGSYGVVLYYDNVYNQSNGEDL